MKRKREEVHEEEVHEEVSEEEVHEEVSEEEVHEEVHEEASEEEVSEEEVSVYIFKNLCVICGSDMGPNNPRQLCGKTMCMFEDFD